LIGTLGMDNQKLKLGVLLDSLFIPAWVYHSIDLLAHSAYAEFSAIILDENNIINPRDHQAQKKNNHIVYSLFNAVDEKFFLKYQNAVEPKDITGLLSSVPIIHVSTVIHETSSFFQPVDLDRIRGCELDIIISVRAQTSGTVQGDILSVSRYGVWEFCFEGYPQGFWEVVEGQPETRVALRVSGAEPRFNGALYLSSVSTYPFSPARNRNRILWQSSSFLPRQIARLHDSGEEDFFNQIAQNNSKDNLTIQKQRYTPPSTLSALGIASKLLFKNLFEIYSRLFYKDGWFLMFDFNANLSIPSSKFHEIIPPKDRFWADPMVIQKDGRHYIFVEEYAFEEKKGHIAVIEVDSDGKYSSPARVLDLPFHLSYPCVFEWQDRYYLVPESADNNTIDLYQCAEFPHKWEYKMSLMQNIKAVDSTLFFYQGKWWLFTGMSENEGSFPEVELFLFYSDNLFTQAWHAHPQNPIVSDVKNARPAGKIFIKDGKIFRPAQDCSKAYGYGINLNQILTLTETEYKEENAVSIIPDWNKRVLATHTYAANADFNVVDAYMFKRKYF
jgi:hypothetical protein